MIDDIFNILNPLSYYEGTVDFFFPNQEDDIILTHDEKLLIVDQINVVKTHLNSAKHNITDENFDDAIDDVKNAINASTCSRCQKKMLIVAYDINHSSNICEIDEERCTLLKNDISASMKDFIENYLPRVEEVLSARES